MEKEQEEKLRSGEEEIWELWGDIMHPFLQMSDPIISDGDWNTEMIKGGNKLKSFLHSMVEKARSQERQRLREMVKRAKKKIPNVSTLQDPANAYGVGLDRGYNTALTDIIKKLGEEKI